MINLPGTAHYKGKLTSLFMLVGIAAILLPVAAGFSLHGAASDARQIYADIPAEETALDVNASAKGYEANASQIRQRLDGLNDTTYEDRNLQGTLAEELLESSLTVDSFNVKTISETAEAREVVNKKGGGWGNFNFASVSLSAHIQTEDLSKFLLFLFSLGSFAYAADRGVVLNYEAVRVRIVIARQIEVLNGLRDTLQFCESYFPIQTQTEIQENIGIDAWSIYKCMLDMKTSGEVFAWYLDYLSKNESIREILRRTFVPAEDARTGANPVYKFGASLFTVRWLWLYATRDGVQIIAQEDVTDDIANQIWETGGAKYIFELRFPLPEEFDQLTQNPFWEKGAAHVLTSFPSATIQEDPLTLVYKVFPHVSSIPAIIKRTLETRGIAPDR